MLNGVYPYLNVSLNMNASAAALKAYIYYNNKAAVFGPLGCACDAPQETGSGLTARFRSHSPPDAFFHSPGLLINTFILL